MIAKHDILDRAAEWQLRPYIVEKDYVLGWLLCAIGMHPARSHWIFKGGTCLRKIVFGSAGRFSEDLDFTVDSAGPEDDVLEQVVETFNREHYGITFSFEDYYKTEDDLSFGGDVRYRHPWNDAGRFHQQASLRERPTLPARPLPMKEQGYFKQVEFELFDVRSLEPIEMIAEKVRAAYQRAKVRDLYDLHRFAATPFDGELLRRLVVLKLWQVRDPFDPDAFFERLHGSRYDWDDLQRLLRSSDRIEPADILAAVEDRFRVLRGLSDLERQLVADARSGWNEPLAERLRAEIRAIRGT